MSGRPEPHGMGHAVRRAVGEAFDATVGRVGERVGETALDISGSTAKQVIEELEPYLIQTAVPRIVQGITPYLVAEIGPQVVDGLTEHLTEVTVPQIIDDLSEHIATETVPAVLRSATPELVAVALPDILDQLRPYLVQELVPQIIDGLVPHINTEVAPAVMGELMPEIRTVIVPQILDDIVDDPKVRDLIREQSQGLLFDAVERVRFGLARADDRLENMVRRVFRQGPRTVAESVDPPAPVGRRFANAGVISRSVSTVVDIVVVSWLVGAGVSSLMGILTSLFGDLPTWVAALVSAIGAMVAPMYFWLCWALAGRTGAEFLVGLKVCLPSGKKPGPIRALVRALVGLPLLFIWAIGLIPTFYRPNRRGWLERFSGTEVRYTVHASVARSRLAVAQVETTADDTATDRRAA